MISHEEAVLLLRGFRQNMTPVRVNMVTAAARCAFEGLISEVSDHELIVAVPQQLRVSCAVLVELEEARFDYGDPRHAPPSVRRSVQEKFASALSILLPDGTLIVISEMNL